MDVTDRGSLPAGPQLRSYAAQFEVRSVPGAPQKVELRGYASVFENAYDMFDMFGPYSEVVRSGAFTKTLSEGPDVAYLTNHQGLTMARTASGSLRLEQDSTGLLTVAQVNTSRQDVRDLVTAVEDGDVDQMSFAFRVIRQTWSPDYEQRDLNEVDINRGDVSAVNFGASPATNVGLARAFRSRKAADLHRIAVELRDGKTPSPAALAALSQALETFAVAADEAKSDDNTRSDAGHLDLLRRQLELEAR